MQLTAPNGQPATFGTSATSIVVLGVYVDLTAHTATITYQPAGTLAPGTAAKILVVNLPAGLQTDVEARAQAAIENNEGWTPGSSSITGT